MRTPFLSTVAKLPSLGVGLGLRRSLFEDTMAHRHSIDWLEIVPENFMGKGGWAHEMLLEAKAQGFPMVSHGVNLSLGSVDPLNPEYLQRLHALFHTIEPLWFSDHLSFSSVDGVYLNDLIPLPFTWEAVNHVVKRIQTLQTMFDRPFCIENISYYALLGPQEMTEAQFLSEILEQADCGLLLDVNNVYVNAHNHGYDAVTFLDALPMDRVIQLHVAGHLRKKHFIVDTHGAPVIDDVWTLLEAVLERCRPKGILLERDNNIPPIEELLDEMVQIRAIAQAVNPKTLNQEVLLR